MRRISGLSAYRSVQAESVALGGQQAELVVMLYDAIEESISQARGCLQRREWVPLGRSITRAMTVLAGLRETLDFERGNPVAGQLLDFYNALTSALMAAQIERNDEGLAHCGELVRDVRSAWQELARRNELMPVVRPALQPLRAGASP